MRPHIAERARTLRGSSPRPPQNVHAHLAQTLMRASRIASHKAVLSHKRRNRALALALVGAILIMFGIGGTLAAATSGLISKLGLAPVVGTGLAAVTIGSLLLLAAPGPGDTSPRRYSTQARQLEQLSRSLRRS